MLAVDGAEQSTLQGEFTDNVEVKILESSAVKRYSITAFLEEHSMQCNFMHEFSILNSADKKELANLATLNGF